MGVTKKATQSSPTNETNRNDRNGPKDDQVCLLRLRRRGPHEPALGTHFGALRARTSRPLRARVPDDGRRHQEVEGQVHGGSGRGGRVVLLRDSLDGGGPRPFRGTQGGLDEGSHPRQRGPARYTQLLLVLLG